MTASAKIVPAFDVEAVRADFPILSRQVYGKALVYLVYTDKLIDGSPQNSTSTVPIMPWGNAGEPPKCSEWIR